MVKKWLEARRKAREIKEFNDGYDWGSGWLMRGQPLDDFLAYTSGAFGISNFDRGAMQALMDFGQWMKSREHQEAFLRELEAAY